MKVEILGMKASDFTNDQNVRYDTTKVYVKTRLDDSKGTQKGYAVAEYNFGTSEEFSKFKHLPFPFMAEVELEQITNGKNVKTVVNSIVPVSQPKAA